jgi:hypothetical protein
MVEKGKPNPALDHFAKLGYDDIERAFLEGRQAAPKENAPGSYERLMTGFKQLEARGKTL